MKKILIVNKSFELGGIQSSMVNMANELSRLYKVDLFIYNPNGVMKERLNDSVRVLESSWRFKCLGMPLKEAIKTKNSKIIAFRLFAAVWSKLFDNRLPINIAIKHQPKMTGYDLAIAYHQEQRKKTAVSGFTRVVDRCVEAKTKAAWLHFDSSTLDLDSEFNNPFYIKMNKIVCVSQSLMKNFSQRYTELESKMDYCYNFLLYEVIKEKSLEQPQVKFDNEKFICVSACRLTEEKALVRCIYAITDTLKKNSDVIWYIAGEGDERSKIQNVIKSLGLEKQIILLGNQSNPYPYMKNADLLLNVSYHEAAPMVFFESKALGVPVMATRTSSAEELLCNGVDSFICDNSEAGIRRCFEELVNDRNRVKSAKKVLEDYSASNNMSLGKIEDLMD